MQTPSVVLNIGADVAKGEIVVACSEGSFPVLKVANQRTALLAFLKGLPASSRIGVESTVSYHELFAETAHQLGFLVFLLNPKDTRHYAKAVGLRGKTDRVDAELIARIIAHEHTKLQAWIPPTPQQREIDRLIKRRATLISLREAVAMSLNELGGFADDLKALKTRFNQLIARLDLRVKALIEANPERKQNFTRLCTISGVGPVIGTALVNTLERVPLKSADARQTAPVQTRTSRTAPAALHGGNVGSKDEDLEATLRALPGKGPIQHRDPRHPLSAHRSYRMVNAYPQDHLRRGTAHQATVERSPAEWAVGRASPGMAE
jgi:transposase